ncbi:MAG: enoyl-CoA hydratase/isomerase family protein [Rhodocyclaceae bacterium]|jgi:enoyl-CoA hydratase/carnithine racemase|nr:enoyl-CoA hydratase/isomerase family protein [Rhodocyclaceae bacterium]
MSDSSAYQHILYEPRDGVGCITLNRPDKLNVLGIGAGSSRDEIARALAVADADDAVGCVLIKAAGRAFCAGGDLSGAAPAITPLDNHLFNEQILRFFAAFRAMHKPVIAAVNGLCIGAGMGFIAQCDLVLAGDDARFGLVEGRIGHPGASELVPIIGAAWAKFLILTGEFIDAERAREIGLVLTVEPAERLHQRAFDLAQRIARMPRDAVLLNKACIDNMSDALGRSVGRLVGRAHDTITKSMSPLAKAPDGRCFQDILENEGMEAMKAARDTQFQGRWLEARNSK